MAEYASVTPGLEDRDRETSGACWLLVEIKVQWETLVQENRVESDRARHLTSFFRFCMCTSVQSGTYSRLALNLLYAHVWPLTIILLPPSAPRGHSYVPLTQFMWHWIWNPGLIIQVIQALYRQSYIPNPTSFNLNVHFYCGTPRHWYLYENPTSDMCGAPKQYVLLTPLEQTWACLLRDVIANHFRKCTITNCCYNTKFT